MTWTSKDLLAVLDDCCESFTFPALDNGYVYPAATRLALYRSPEDWAMVIEVFGFSPRSGIPDTHIYTFASQLLRQKNAKDFVTQKAYDTYLENNPHNESAFIYPIEEGDWQDPENSELLAKRAHTVQVRDRLVPTPALPTYAAQGIALEDPPNIHVFELCRVLAASCRESVLATADERRMCVPNELLQVMQLEEWLHPDVLRDKRPSASATFNSLADILTGADVSSYKPSTPPNTHWGHWPEGGCL